jgi:hypothetical protein
MVGGGGGDRTNNPATFRPTIPKADQFLEFFSDTETESYQNHRMKGTSNKKIICTGLKSSRRQRPNSKFTVYSKFTKYCGIVKYNNCDNNVFEAFF